MNERAHGLFLLTAILGLVWPPLWLITFVYVLYLGVVAGRARGDEVVRRREEAAKEAAKKPAETVSLETTFHFAGEAPERPSAPTGSVVDRCPKHPEGWIVSHEGKITVPCDFCRGRPEEPQSSALPSTSTTRG